MRTATQIKCKEALELVYEGKETYRNASKKRGVAMGTLKKFRDSETGKKVEMALKAKYLSSDKEVRDSTDTKLRIEIVGDRPHWINPTPNGFIGITPHVNRESIEHVVLRVYNEEDQSDESYLNVTINPS